MHVRKYLASILVITLNLSSLSSSMLSAKEGTMNSSSNNSQISSLSREVREKLFRGKQQLESLGNPTEYKDMEIQWDNKKGKPGEIRKLHKKASKDIAGDTKKVFQDLSSLYNISPTASPDVRLEKDTISGLSGEHHARLQQYYNNLEIIGGELISHVSPDGFIYQIDGAVDIPTISTKPTVSKEGVLLVAKKEHGNKLQFAVTKQPELVLYKFASSYILAYRYIISYDDPIAHMGQWVYYIDATTGKKINSYNLIHDALNPVAISGALLTSEGGEVKTFTGAVSTISGKYYLDHKPVTSGEAIIFNASSNSGLYTDAGVAANRSTSSWGTSDPTEISAIYNISKTLEYYNTLGFSTNNITFAATGQTYLPVVVHFGNAYNNAFWNPGDGLYIGDGDGVSMKSLATLDVMAHEFGHAWTDNTSKLVYQNEQGALNESFSDISGVNVELYAQQDAKNMYPNTGSGQADWLIGEDIMIGTRALRDMRNPANTATVGTGNEQPTRYHGTYWYGGSGDNGGVHYNNSVQNLFYYLLAEGGSGNNDGILYSVDGIGIEAARAIAFETNTHFVTSTTDYKGVRQAWIDAANSLHPTDISFANSVKAAWDAVGVISDPIIPLATSTESFEDSTNLPTGYSSSLVTGTGDAWSVTTTTGALGNNSLVSGIIANNSVTAVSWSGVTDTGYMTFYWRTSSEAGYDSLDFYVDGMYKKSWSGINPWSFYSEAMTSGSHVLRWEYYKDEAVTAGLDQVGIDAVHMVSLTGALDIGSDTGSGQYVSGSGFHGLFTAPTSYDYTVLRSDAQIIKGNASGSLSFPLTGLPEGSGSIDFQYRDTNGFLSQIYTRNFFLDSINPGTTQIASPMDESFSNTGNITLSWNPVTDTGAGLSINPYTYIVSTSSGFTNTIASGSTNSTGAVISLTNGTYFFKVIVRDLAGNTSISPVVSFYVPKVVYTTDTSSVIISTGSVIFSGASGTGSTVFLGTGTLSIKNENIPTDTITMSLSGLIITTDGTGVWNGIIESPKTAVLTGITLSESGYTLTGSVYKAGNNSVSLGFSGQYAGLQIYIGTAFNGKTLHVYRSDSGPVFDYIDSCIVSSGMCQFQTNHFSYFAFGEPNDGTPDTFAFTPQTGVEISTNIDSNSVTLTGMNIPAIISMSGGLYSINSLAYTGSAGTISNGDTVKVRVISSASYSTLKQVTLTIGGISTNFSVTTKSAPVSSGGGGGGGGGISLTIDVCPTGDLSGNSYDGKCTVTFSTQASLVSTGVVVTKSSLFTSNLVVSSYSFPGNERIPQKVVAELNFFITKLTNILDKKAGDDTSKKSRYYKMTKEYILNRAKKTTDKRDKQILSYLYTRFTVIENIKNK